MADLQAAVTRLKDFEAKLVAKAMQDDDFRTALLQDAKGTVAKEAGKELPEGLIVKILEDQPNTLTIILPKKPAKAAAEGELSDKALEKAAGGEKAYSAIYTVVYEVVAD